MKDRSRKLAVINTGRKPQIESGGATTTVVHAGIGGGGGGSMNLSDYLLKQIWDKAFEIRTTETGEEYLFGKLNFATQYGITMYANGGLLDLPSIFEGIPIDNNTIYWEETKDEEGNVIARVLKSRGVGEGGVTLTLLGDLTNVGSWANAVAAEDRIMVQKKGGSSWSSMLLSELGGGNADFSNVLSSGTGNAFTSFTLSEDKKTLTFLKGKTFAEKSTSLSGYGITDAYTKTQVDNKLGDFATSDDVKTLLEDYLPLTGGTITGDLRLQSSDDDTISPYLYFGDLKEVYLAEVDDRYLTIHAYNGILLDSPKTVIDGIEIKKLASGTLFIDANLVVSGGVAMYGTDGTTANTIWDDAPIASTTVKGIASFDSNYFAVNNGKVTFIGSTGGGGGIDSITKQMVIDALGFTPYDEDNPDGFITGITKTMVTNALGYTPYSSANPNGYVTSSGSVAYAASAGSAEDADYATTSGSCLGNAATATTASKLSTVSKSAWGQTYWTSGGVPTSISGDMSSVWNIECSSGWTYSIGTNSKPFLYLYGNIISGGTSAQLSFMINGITLAHFDKSANLHVYGGISASDAFKVSDESSYDLSSYLVQIKAHSSAPGIGFAGDSYNWYVQVYNDYMYVGRGTTNAFRIDPSGNCLSIGGITMYSDIRKKTILNHVELSLKEVADAPLIEHYYNSDEKKTTHVGSVAQYWAELNDWFCKEDGEGFLTMEIQNVALASAISVARELTRYESKTDKQIKKLKKRIGELEEEIENLKKM